MCAYVTLADRRDGAVNAQMLTWASEIEPLCTLYTELAHGLLILVVYSGD
jgi:hypothetical protein